MSWKEWLSDSQIPWNWIFVNLIPQKEISEKNYHSPTRKKVTVQIYPLEKYTLKQKPLEKIVIKGSSGFLHPYPCMDKK